VNYTKHRLTITKFKHSPNITHNKALTNLSTRLRSGLVCRQKRLLREQPRSSALLSCFEGFSWTGSAPQRRLQGEILLLNTIQHKKALGVRQTAFEPTAAGFLEDTDLDENLVG